MKKNKAVLVFLLRFFVSYLLLYSGYQLYLKKYQQKNSNGCDPITQLVAKQTVSTANTIGYDFNSEQHEEEASIKLFIDRHYTARVVEGCNSISIIILFWAFIIAFAGKWQNTLLFGVIGSLSIYFLNIGRIIFLTVILNNYPKHSDFWHQLVFPAIIYGFTFVLWIIWVRFFALKNSANND